MSVVLLMYFPVSLKKSRQLDLFQSRIADFHIEYNGLTAEQRAHRLLLRALMTKHGFRPYEREWWHFTLEDEPFPEIYVDFPVR